MANVTYDMMWQEAMAELNEQVHIEDHTMGIPEGVEPPPPPPQVPILEAYQHYACLYIKYMQIFKRMEECYDAMVHPQKRLDVKQVLELVMIRVVELKHLLVKWNPPNPDVKKGDFPQERNFPWEYINLDDILVDLKLPPETLEVPVPRYFIEDHSTVIRNRERLVKGYMNLKLHKDKVPLETEEDPDDFLDFLTVEQAIEIIQKNERGRQGKERALVVKEVREEEKQRRMYDAAPQNEMDPELAASNIQRLFRGFHSRAEAAAERDDELVFIGMKPPRHRPDDMERELENARQRRKAEQDDNKNAYEKALVDLREVVAEEEGPLMREQMMEERRNWFTDVMVVDGYFPDDLTQFYLMKNPPPKVEEEPEDAGKGGKKGKDAGKGKKDEKKGKEKKGKKKKKEKEEEGPPEQPPQLTGPSEIVGTMSKGVGAYDTLWLDRDESDNFQQKHDVGLAKDKVRPNVEEEVRKQVDEMLQLQLQKIKMQLVVLAAKPAGKKKKKDKGGKKKKKDKGKKGKKGKDAKSKLRGDKIPKLKTMDIDQMLAILVDNKIVNNYRPKKVSDLWGDFNYLGTVFQNAERRDKFGNWVPEPPSMAQIRQSITEYAVLPLGSENVRQATRHIKSMLLYGPKGAGKTAMVEAIANETGALLLNLSPKNLAGKFLGKTGPTELVHMAFKVAADPSMVPCVIYVDEIEQILAPGGKKKKGAPADAEGPSRFATDLAAYAATALTQKDRVIMIGCTSEPEKADPKHMKNLFYEGPKQERGGKNLYMPYPDYPSRVIIWKEAIKEAISLGATQWRGNHPSYLPTGWRADEGPRPPSVPIELSEEFDFSTLAHISQGYSAGSVRQAVKQTLTRRRVDRLEKRPLKEKEFITALSRCPITYPEDYARFTDFTAEITRLAEVREARKAELKSAEGGDDAKGAKKGGKKKK
jgi:hypothetical protein